MSQVTAFLKKNWITLLLLVGSIAAVRWVVLTQRHVGAMSIIEAQAMDMTAMKAPVGVVPVAVEPATVRLLSASGSYPAHVYAYTDEDIVARVPGQIEKMLVYPGDKVRAGQLLAVLDADEFSADQRMKAMEAAAMRAEIDVANREIERHAHLQAEARAKAKMAESALSRSEAELDGMRAELQKSQNESRKAFAEVEERVAEANYAQKEIARQRELHRKKVISLAELQEAERDYATAESKLRAAQAQLDSSEASVEITKRKVKGAEDAVKESLNARTASRAVVAQTDASVLQAREMAKAAKARAQAASASASGAASLADYRNLRALSSGVVSERVISPGTAVMPGQVVLKVKTMDRARVQADLPQQLATEVQVGNKARVTTDGFSEDATVSAVFPTIVEETRTFHVEAIIDNHSSKLRPGMYTRMQVFTSDAKPVLTVKKQAVRTDEVGAKFVWVVGKREAKPGEEAETDWTCTMHPEVSEDRAGICPSCKMDLVPRTITGEHEAQRRSVQIGESDDEYVEIKNGLHEGETVIWAGYESLIEGTLVEPTEWGPDGPVELPKPAHSQKVEGHEGHGTTDESKAEEASGKTNQHEGHGAPEPKGKAPSAAYVCPMHPEITSDKPGSCSICKMDLVPSRKGASKAADAKASYVCPMHPEIKSDKPGSCSICKMDLEKKDQK